MAGETENIMKMAEKLSSELFAFFGWKISGPANKNFPCTNIEAHKKTKHPKHPADCVFHYSDAYDRRKIYICTDLKSYGNSSIDGLSANKLQPILRSLGNTAKCADELPGEFATHYIHTDEPYRVHGLLFIYNHEKIKIKKEQKKNERKTGRQEEETSTRPMNDILSTILGVTNENLGLSENHRVYVLSPERIQHLYAVACDIKSVLFANDITSSSDQWRFHSPDKIRKPAIRDNQRAATIEDLLSPWIILAHTKPKSPDRHFVLYSDTTGDNKAEFLYILDFLFRANLIESGKFVTVKQINHNRQAPSYFEKAKEHFSDDYYGSDDFKERMSRVSYSGVASEVPVFSELVIGMEQRHIK